MRAQEDSTGHSQRPGASSPVATHQVALALALLLTFIAYCATLGFQFVYDDRGQILDNPWVRSWRFLPRYFTMHVWGVHNPDELGNYYRPLFLLWLRVNYLFFEQKSWGWHLSSLLLHVAVTFFVYLLARRILTDRVTAATAALLFGVHPLHIESVAWISGVTEPLMAVLLIPSFLCYLEAREAGGRSRGWTLASLLLCFLAMFAKETALVLPLLVFSYEWIYRGGEQATKVSEGPARRFRHSLRCMLPYLAVISLYLLARATALQGLSHTVTPLRFSTIVFTWPSLIWFYIKLLIWPSGLSAFYDTPYVTRPGMNNVVLPALAVASTAFIIWVWARKTPSAPSSESPGTRSRVVAFSSAWLVLPVLPLLNLTYLPLNDIAHDRYMYLPLVGFSIIAAVALHSLRMGRATLFGVPAVQVMAAGAVALGLVLSTVFQSLIWADELSLYSHAVQVAPNSRNVKINLANVACERGLYQAGIKLYKDVIERYPDYWLTYYDLGYTYYKLGNLEEADRCFRRVAEFNILSANGFLYLGLIRLKMGRVNEAIPYLRHAAEVAEEGSPGYHFALGIVLKVQGDLTGALNEFKEELKVEPEQKAAREQIVEIEKLLRNPGRLGSPAKAEAGGTKRGVVK